MSQAKRAVKVYGPPTPSPAEMRRMAAEHEARMRQYRQQSEAAMAGSRQQQQQQDRAKTAAPASMMPSVFQTLADFGKKKKKR
jgi:hypothetical protein